MNEIYVGMLYQKSKSWVSIKGINVSMDFLKNLIFWLFDILDLSFDFLDCSR